MPTTKMKKTITAPPRSFKAFVCNDGHEDCIRSKQLVMSVISMTIRCESPVAWLYFDELRRQKEDWKEAWTWSWLCLSEVPEFSWVHIPSICLQQQASLQDLSKEYTTLNTNASSRVVADMSSMYADVANCSLYEYIDIL
jgi:hypothetical protein